MVRRKQKVALWERRVLNLRAFTTRMKPKFCFMRIMKYLVLVYSVIGVVILFPPYLSLSAPECRLIFFDQKAAIEPGLHRIDTTIPEKTQLKTPFPIDIVYTWVDGRDPKWRAEYEKASNESNVPINSKNANARYKDLDELKYSLRSIEANIDWYNNIYIVTANQRPAWIKEDAPKIIFINHEDIFPNDTQLPSFSSNAIECSLHNIPGLSEHFIYFNDDVFIGRKLPYTFFFTPEGKPIMQYGTSDWPEIEQFLRNVTRNKFRNDMGATQYGLTSMHTTMIVKNHFNKFSNLTCPHAPFPMKKSINQEAEKIWKMEFLFTRRHRFRHYRNIIIQLLVLQYGDMTHQIELMNSSSTNNMFYMISSDIVVKRLPHDPSNLPKTLCVNTDDLIYYYQVISWMNSMWGIQSKFEKDGYNYTPPPTCTPVIIDGKEIDTEGMSGAEIHYLIEEAKKKLKSPMSSPTISVFMNNPIHIRALYPTKSSVINQHVPIPTAHYVPLKTPHPTISLNAHEAMPIRSINPTIDPTKIPVNAPQATLPTSYNIPMRTPYPTASPFIHAPIPTAYHIPMKTHPPIYSPNYLEAHSIRPIKQTLSPTRTPIAVPNAPLATERNIPTNTPNPTTSPHTIDIVNHGHIPEAKIEYIREIYKAEHTDRIN